jgi:hypothetical protein
MSIDIGNFSLRVQECLLATLLVCDWNVRAWTLLESMRGRRNICLLCKDNRVVPLKQILKEVFSKGSIDLAILFLTAQNLLPTQPPPNDRPHPALELRAKGFVNVEEAACLLSHRYATRPGDEVVIWSLLCNKEALHSSKAFWESRYGRVLNTGFLMSSAPRLRGYRGLSWAPLRPDLPAADVDMEKRYFASDGEGSSFGLVKEEGFKADWFVYELKGTCKKSHLKARSESLWLSRTRRQCRQIASQYLQHRARGCLLHPSLDVSRGQARYVGSSGQLLFAVVASDDGVAWEWKGVYEWDARDPPPEFRVREILLV